MFYGIFASAILLGVVLGVIFARKFTYYQEIAVAKLQHALREIEKTNSSIEAHAIARAALQRRVREDAESNRKEKT